MPKQASSSGIDKRNPALKNIRDRIAKVPAEPGVYRWLDAQGNVLYVGKAKNLRNRLRSYVAADGMKSQGPWKMALVEQVQDFDVVVTRNELEALLLETNLIKEKKPKYNVLMKDDKHYVYLKVATEEAYPRIDVVRRMENDKAKYFGPFLTAWELKNTLDMLHRVLGYRACKQSLDALNRDPEKSETLKPCLDSQIGQCNGLCAAKISYEEYRARIDALLSFFRGNYDPVLTRANALMAEAASEKRFERAAEFRNVIQYIESLKTKQSVSDTDQSDVDAVGVALLSGKAQVVLLRKRGGKLLSEYQLSLQGFAENESAILSQFLPQYYAETPDIPATILVPCDIEDRATLEEWLQQKRGTKVHLHVPERGKKSSLLDLAIKNAEQKVKQSEAKWEAEARNIESSLLTLKEKLSLPDLPKRIECYDISHFGGTETVGSMVVFANGKPKKDHYRSFTIRTVESGNVDDYKSLQETLRRRLKYVAYSFAKEEEEWKKKGIKAAKATKKDAKKILDALGNHAPDPFLHTEFFTLKKGDDILAFMRLHEESASTFVLDRLFVAEGDNRLAMLHFLLGRIVKSLKKGKLYVAADLADENTFAQVGFRHLHVTPDFLKIKKEQLGMMFEAIQNKKDPSFTSRPDLLLIDGGKGQLNAIVDVLEELKLSIPVAGLAKRFEEIFLPGEKYAIDLPSHSPESFLLQRLRDEAHRFANSLRETKGMKAMTMSALDTIPGIGPKTRTELLKKFGSVDGMKKASDEELKTIVNGAQLQALRNAL